MVRFELAHAIRHRHVRRLATSAGGIVHVGKWKPPSVDTVSAAMGWDYAGRWYACLAVGVRSKPAIRLLLPCQGVVPWRSREMGSCHSHGLWRLRLHFPLGAHQPEHSLVPQALSKIRTACRAGRCSVRAADGSSDMGALDHLCSSLAVVGPFSAFSRLQYSPRLAVDITQPTGVI
jgi:hypothetical protein